ncbi:MAG: hypothetical protein KKA05_02510, partial [Alphaproteobacteria bacterium]|nr:hypothetical protein [Alphaproteobacteria bacterium]
MTAPENNTPETPPTAPERGVLSNIWRSKAMLPVRVAYWAASPVWWPTVQAVKLGMWGLKSDNKVAKTLVPTFAAAALATYGLVGSYVATYGVVAAGDRYWFGQPYSEGDRTGRISKLSMVGKFPCNSVEGELAMPNLGSGGSSTFSFSARSLGPLNDDVIADLRTAYEKNEPVSLSYEQSHWPKEWFDREQEGWFLPHIDGFACYQKTDYNIVKVTPRPGLEL